MRRMAGISNSLAPLRLCDPAQPNVQGCNRPEPSLPRPVLDPGPALSLPADFGRRFLICADAEEEFDWSGPFSRRHVKTTAARALPAATQRFQAMGVQPVYLCDYPMIDTDRSAEINRGLVEDGLCAVGAQLHPWVTPPFDEALTPRNSFASNLPHTLEEAKLIHLTRRLTDQLGCRPLLYRAGRYGIRAASFPILARLGYRLDLSVRSHFDYRAQGGPNFRGLPLHPWATGDDIICLPLTTGWTGPLRRLHPLHRLRMLRGPLSRLRLLQRVPMTPEGTPLRSALEAIARLDADEVRVFHLSFHTPSLVPGHTPYVRTTEDLRVFWRWWDGVLAELDRRGIAPTTSASLLNILAQATEIRR